MEREKYSFIFSKNIFLIKSLNLQPLRARTYSTSTWHRDQISFNRSLRNSQTQNLTNPRVKYLTNGKKRKTQIFELKLTFFIFGRSTMLDEREHMYNAATPTSMRLAGAGKRTDAFWRRQNICRATFQIPVHLHRMEGPPPGVLHETITCTEWQASRQFPPDHPTLLHAWISFVAARSAWPSRSPSWLLRSDAVEFVTAKPSVAFGSAVFLHGV